MTKPILMVLCGLQCSGKSTYAKSMASIGYEVLSSDKLREEYPSANNDTIFRLLYEQMNKLLSEGRDVVIDATNTTIKSRRQIFLNLKVDCEKWCHIFNTPYEECVRRLKERNETDYPHKFDEDVIKRYYYSFEIPFYEEGWDLIKINNHPDSLDALVYQSKLIIESVGFNQQNKHHTQNLDIHNANVGLMLEEKTKDSNLVKAGYYHDIGKLFTKTYRDGDPNAHYYSHANVGAYNLLCYSGCYFGTWNKNYGYATDSTLEWLFYINYHMHLFNITTEKAKAKWIGIFGKKKYDNLLLLHECDKARPEV